MGVGVYVGSKESNSEDYFLAGKTIPWYAVAGSIFGTNISANHLVGMLGIGFSIGFAQTHFELGAAVALLLLAYVFLPIYMKLNVFTLSEYLEKRFGPTSSLLYTFASFFLIMVQMTAAFYIGSRTLNILLASSGIHLSYISGIFCLIGISCTYTVFGGLKAVVWTDFIQTIVLLLAGILVAILTFMQPEINGWSGFMANDAAQAVPKMNLYFPSDHESLPWTGVFSGLMILHLFYWGNNQYLVQRALAAKSLKEARVGIFFGMSLKLLVPFFSVAGGIAAAQLFSARGLMNVAPDDAFSELVRIVVPAGYGIMGIIGAGLLGAIISSIDSMMNSAATLATIDIYKKYVNRNASEDQTVFIGRVTIIILVLLSAAGAVFTYDPTGKSNFFLIVSSQSSNFTPGIVAAFVFGIFSKRFSRKGAIFSIITSPLVSYLLDGTYKYWGEFLNLTETFGSNLNFMHRTMLVFIWCGVIGLLVSDPKKAKVAYTWSNLVESPNSLRSAFKKSFLILIFTLFNGFFYFKKYYSGELAAILSFLIILIVFLVHISQYSREKSLLKDDRLLAGLISALTSTIFYLF